MRQYASEILKLTAWIGISIAGLAPGEVTASADTRLASEHSHPASPSQISRPLELDHVMICVSPGAPERVALERAGFRLSPDVNHHDGQGTASITFEFANSFLELLWREDSVSVAPGLEKVAARFERMGEWRMSGWSPFGLGLRRTPSGPDSLPFPTRAVSAPWMRPGAKLEIVSPADDTLGPRIWIVPRMMAANGKPDSDAERQRLSQLATFDHPNGARRITRVKVSGPRSGLTPTTQLAARYGPVLFGSASHWLIEITLDGGARGATRDLRPDLPLIVHL